MQELIKDFIESSRERIKTPITGSFTLAFLIYNWRPILLLLFSNASIEDKIVVINNEYCGWGALVGPLVIALLYVAAVPYIMMWLEKGTKSAVEGRKTHKSDQTLFDLKNAKSIAFEEFEIEQIKSGHKEIADLNDEISSLKILMNSQAEQHKSKFESYETIIENYRLNDEAQTQLVSNLVSDIDSRKKEKDKILEFSGFKYILDRFKLGDITFYLNLVSAVLKNARIEDYDTEAIKRFESLDLIVEGDDNYKVTVLGMRMYNYLEYLNVEVPF